MIGFGNELLSDDAIGVLVARELAREVPGKADVIECNLSGLSLLDLFVGHDKAIIIDAICTRKVPTGTIIELNPKDLRVTASPSPHYAGLPEVIQMAERLQLDFPKEIKILALEVADPHTIGGELSKPVANALSELVNRVKACLREWEEEAIGV